MVVVIKGDETYFVDDIAYELTGGDVFVSYVSQPHGSGSRTQGVNEIIWFLIDPDPADLFDQSPNKAYMLRSHLLSMKDHRLKADNECIVMLKKSIESYLKFNESNRQYAAQLFVCFLYRLLFMQHDLSQNDSVMIHALEYIEKNICNCIELHDLSDLCGMSLSGFKLKFKQFTGKTPRDYINIRKISKSKEQLQNGKMITETAMELGFNSSDYFSYVFKKYMAISPSQFVRQHARKLPKMCE